MFVVFGQERIHKGQRGALCPSARRGGRYGAVGGCYEERYGPAHTFSLTTIGTSTYLSKILEAASQASKAR